MTREERKLALYCLKASSDYHSEVCEECIKYPNCDHTGQDDVTETIIKALEHEPKTDKENIHREREQAYMQGYEDACRKYRQEPREDAISRQQAIDEMQELENEDIEAYGCAIPECFDGQRAIERLKALPSILLQPRFIVKSDGTIEQIKEFI